MPPDHHKSSHKIITARQRTSESNNRAHSAAAAREGILAIAKVLACQAAQEDDAAEAHQSAEFEGPDQGASSNPREFR